MRTIGIERPLPLSTFRQRIDEELRRAAWVHLEVKVTRDGVLPELHND